MNRTRHFRPPCPCRACYDWREHNTRQKRLTVVLLVVLAVGVWLLVHTINNP